MEFRDLKKQYQVLKKDIDIKVQQVFSDANYIMGNEVAELEEQLAQYVGVKHCITCANGTDALLLALMVWDIGPGDAVFVPDFTFFSTGEVVATRGATPVFVDVDKETFNMDTNSLISAIDKVLEEGKLLPKVIVPVDLFGLPANFEKISEIAVTYNMKVLEDGAQGFGGEICGRKACSFGDIATTSFFPAKPLGCYGDGGAIFTNNDKWADLLKSYRVHGKGQNKYDNIRIGLNSRLDTVQAAILQVKLKAFKEYELDSVNAAAQKYTEKLCKVVKTPNIPKGYYSSWAQYTIVLKDRAERDRVQKYLKNLGIPTMIYYVKPMHLQEAFKEFDANKVPCELTEQLCDTVLSLPMHPYITDEDISKVCDTLLMCLSKK